ncbi:hypothetical protein ARAM_000349 [Aspergillus rambellii]|uniref:Uncharacterized protein n=1 Tax=Aspergillus rambellii TaxID=308745 RepID=A0A0F8UMG6_9EURO|nr:hypothetical protein ARAM_000349 [Aspergillus rambellii]
MSDPARYTIGWICAILTEYVAAKVTLDETHEKPASLSPNDTNNYTLGKIGKHNVVIAVLPDGEYGPDSAASVATSMLRSFPNIRIGLMVGTGGGVPSEQHDIRLGDIVVSAPCGGTSGVFQYDFGKSIQGQGFVHTRFLNQPPTVLRTAITEIQARYEIEGHRLVETVNELINKHPTLRQKYERPQSSTDRLFKSQVTHHAGGCGICAKNPLDLVSRRERTENDDNPTIHYGLIASANQLMEDALIRDRLAAEKNVLCFETVAAGLVNDFPCLVIRGIYNYSDSHKSNEWQGYAAMVAAAYAKDLLREIIPNTVEAEKRVGGILSGLQDVAEEHKNISQKQLDLQENEVKQRLFDRQLECLRLFRLTSSADDTTYEWYKDRVQARVPGTCEWFLKHETFHQWLEQDSGLLLVSADPGCGKSVLTKYLIDENLLRSETICYFFFKSQDQDTVRQALCALLHQLFIRKPLLIEYAMPEFENNGRDMINSTISLWTILENAIRDPQAGPITIVLDALDECTEFEISGLIPRIKSQFRNSHSGYSRLKYLFTSRPYEQIMGKFQSLLESFPYVRIPGEEESTQISQEVKLVIEDRVERLAREKDLSDQVKHHLRKKLLDISHRTYLWVYLVFDYLEREHFKKTPKGIDDTIATLPRNIYEAYEQILKKSKQDHRVRKALSMILAANRPLTVSEMNVALNVDRESKSLHDLDLEDDKDFRSRLRNWCGLFVSIHHDKVYFLHETAREFLLVQTPAPPPTIPSESRWYHSISSQDAHRVLAEVCVLYLDFLNNESFLDAKREDHQLLDLYTFLDYSAKNWDAHYLEASSSMCADLISSALSICDPKSRSWSAWFKTYRESKDRGPPNTFTSLMISSYFGHVDIVRLLLEQYTNIESKDTFGQTPLSWAARNGHESVIRLLLEQNAHMESKDTYRRTPLSWAVKKGHEDIIRVLLRQNADIESKVNYHE